MKKIDKSALFLKEHLDLFRCPVCASDFKNVIGNQLICGENHTYNLSKKGTIYFLMKPSKTEYSREMLLSRQRIAKMGFWKPMLDVLYPLINKNNGVTLDAGCGEGAHSAYLKEKGLKGPVIAFDISKEGINLGAATYSSPFFVVADLAQSPFQTSKFDTILNILSPSNYDEFDRLLKENGRVIKVVPGKNYLTELRSFQTLSKQTYSNEEVKNKFMEHFKNVENYPVNYTVELTDEEIRDFLKMTPLAWNIDIPKTKYEKLRRITIDMEILVGNKTIEE